MGSLGNSLKMPSLKVESRTHSLHYFTILPSEAVPLKLSCAHLLPGDLVKMQIVTQPF